MSEQKIEAFWRDATAEDIAKVMKGEKVEARFRDRYADGWAEYYLSGVNGKGWIAGNFRWDLCQVYEPQQWWLDKPDPGEGWRLLDPFSDEQPILGDCTYCTINKRWVELKPNFLPGRRPEAWYRRRIETNSPEKLDSSRSKDYIPTGWIKLSDDEPRLASDAYWSQGASEWCLIGVDRLEYANRDKWPAIRQVENWRCMQLMEGCFYRLPNGHGIKVTKKGFDVF
jgi:hypothetical protein